MMFLDKRLPFRGNLSYLLEENQRNPVGAQLSHNYTDYMVNMRDLNLKVIV